VEGHEARKRFGGVIGRVFISLPLLVLPPGVGEFGGEDAIGIGGFGDGEGFSDDGWGEVPGREVLVVVVREEEGNYTNVDLS
jgi:hypothetical protein